jgi:hypothetical protein
MSDFDLNKALKSISSRFTDDQRAEQESLSKRGRAGLAANSMENRITLAEAQEISVRETIHLLDRKKNTNFRQPAMQNLGQFVSLDHGRLVRLKVCRMCNFVNAS